MDAKAVAKTLVAGALAASASAGTPYLADQPVDVVQIVITALTAVVAYLSKSPRE